MYNYKQILKTDPAQHLLLDVCSLQKLQDIIYKPLFEYQFFIIPQSDTAGTTTTETVNDEVTTNTTQFIDSKSSSETTLVNYKTPDMKSFLPSIDQDIRSFLGRPHLVLDGSVTAATPIGLVATVNPASFLFTDPLLNSKMKGVFAVRYTTLVTLKINSTRFQAGALMLCYVPTGGSINLTTIRTISLTNRVQYSQTMNVKANFAYDSSVSLRVPYISDRYCHEYISNPNGNPGVIDLYLYAPLNFLTGSSSVPYTVFISYHDVEFFGNTIPQSGFATSKKKRQRTQAVDVGSNEMFSERPISTATKFISDVSDKLTAVPLLSSIAGPVHWISDAVSKAAYLWGYSRPRIIEKPSRMSLLENPNMCNSDSSVLTQPIGLSLISCIEKVTNFAGHDEDEMSIDFLKRRWSFYESFNWSTSSPDGTILYATPVKPNNYFVNSTTSAANVLTPICFITSLAKKWTGGIEFRIELFKTTFHSGRLAFIYIPNNGAAVTPTLANLEYAFKIIVDITDYNIIEISVPYMSTNTWLPTEPVGSTNGNFYIMALDSLVAPADVPSSISVLVSVRGAPDFAIAQPSQAIPAVAVAQSGLGKDETLQLNIGDIAPSGNDFSKNSQCIGETFLSLKNLISVYRFCGVTFSMNEVTSVSLVPHAFSYKGTTGYNNFERDILSPIAMCYALYRGGINIYIPQEVNSTRLLTSSLATSTANTHPIESFAVDRANTLAFIHASPTQVYRLDQNNAHVNIPFFNYTPSASVIDSAYNLSSSAVLAKVHPTLNFRILSNGNAPSVASNFDIFRCAADDYQLGCFISIPVLLPYTI